MCADFPVACLPRRFKIASEDGGLTLTGLNLANAPLTALSESLFTYFGTHFEFDKNDQGAATCLMIHGAERDCRADRKK